MRLMWLLLRDLRHSPPCLSCHQDALITKLYRDIEARSVVAKASAQKMHDAEAKVVRACGCVCVVVLQSYAHASSNVMPPSHTQSVECEQPRERVQCVFCDACFAPCRER
jgi:hypothetical protein